MTPMPEPPKVMIPYDFGRSEVALLAEMDLWAFRAGLQRRLDLSTDGWTCGREGI